MTQNSIWGIRMCALLSSPSFLVHLVDLFIKCFRHDHYSPMLRVMNDYQTISLPTTELLPCPSGWVVFDEELVPVKNHFDLLPWPRLFSTATDLLHSATLEENKHLYPVSIPDIERVKLPPDQARRFTIPLDKLFFRPNRAASVLFQHWSTKCWQ